jgi:hypothetical protein
MADLEFNKVFAKVTKATKLSTSFKCNDDPSFQLGHMLKAYHSMYSVLQGAIVPFRLHSSRKQNRPFKNRQVLDQLLWLRRLLKTLVARRSRGQRGIRGNPLGAPIGWIKDNSRCRLCQTGMKPRVQTSNLAPVHIYLLMDMFKHIKMLDCDLNARQYLTMC